MVFLFGISMIVNYFMYNILVEKLFIVGNELLVCCLCLDPLMISNLVFVGAND